MSTMSDEELIKELRDMSRRTPHEFVKPILELAADRIRDLGMALDVETYRSRGMQPWTRAGIMRDNK